MSPELGLRIRVSLTPLFYHNSKPPLQTKQAASLISKLVAFLPHPAEGEEETKGSWRLLKCPKSDLVEHPRGPSQIQSRDPPSLGNIWMKDMEEAIQQNAVQFSSH